MWGIPDWMIDDPRWKDHNFLIEERNRRISLHSLYPERNFPEIQLGKILSAPFKQRLKAFAKTPEFASLGQKLFVLKVELFPKHTSSKEELLDRCEDPVMCWRLLTCFGDTNLNAFHDQILAPAMGWRRNFHAYRYIVPTNGASIFPQDTSAIDRQHLIYNTPTYSLDTADYDVRHLLQKPGDRLIYNYDLGDNWYHTIKVLTIQELGTTLKGSELETLDEQTFKAVQKKEWTLEGSSLLWGEINCPPEDSLGCNGMGRYGNASEVVLFSFVFILMLTFCPLFFPSRYSKWVVTTRYRTVTRLLIGLIMISNMPLTLIWRLIEKGSRQPMLEGKVQEMGTWSFMGIRQLLDYLQ